MKDAELHMWQHLRDKYGVAIAMQQCYPNLMRDNMLLTAAVLQLHIAEQAINAIMENLQVEE